MARPLKTGADKRTDIIRVRVTPAEKTQLLQQASEAGYCASDFIRLKVTHSSPLRQKPTPERESLLKLHAELGKIGSNVNQIAHVLNTYALNGEPLDVPEDIIKNALYGIQALTHAIHNELRNGH